MQSWCVVFHGGPVAVGSEPPGTMLCWQGARCMCIAKAVGGLEARQADRGGLQAPHGLSVDLATSLVAAGRSVLQRRETYVCCVSRADAALCAGCTQVVTHLCQLPCWATAWVCKGCCEHGTARVIATRQPLRLASRQIVVVVYAQ